MEKSDKLSVFISLVLRHKPEAAGICLDEHGWADVDELLRGINICFMVRQSGFWMPL